MTNFSDANLSNATLKDANLSNATLKDANLTGANLSGADLSEVNLSGRDLSGKDLRGTILRKTILRRADLSQADLVEAILSGAQLQRATLVGTNLQNANLEGCYIHGISAWNIDLEGANQSSLVITEDNEPIITVDNLKVAQFIYLLLTNKEIREVIDTITSKVVLILGRFTPKRKAILDALREELRASNYSPILFDFEKPTSRDLTETISTLAHMARFVIADITGAKSIPQELQQIVPDLPSVPILLLLQARAKEYSMAEHFKRYEWVLPVYRYHNVDHLRQSMKEHIIKPAEQRFIEVAPKPLKE